MEWSNGAAAGGIAGYSVAPHGPSTSRIIGGLAVASQDLATLDAGVEYGFGTITINHQKTAGAGACGGCTTPVCIFLSRVKLDFPPVTGQPSRDILLERGANFVGSQYVTWQGGYPVNVQVQCDVPALSCGQHYTGFDCVLATPTWLRGSTWGQVKSLYRQLAPDSPDSRPRP